MSFRNYILSLMKDERRGPVAAVIKAALTVLSGFYSAGVRLVDLGYLSGLRKVYKAPVPVISVGNLTLGGTGKTPFTIFLTDLLLSMGRKPAVLTRGYGKDEDRLLREELPDVPVFVGQDRVRGASAAVAAGCDVIVMDDGFQHRRLYRDLDIVLVDARALFGNAKLFPRGLLRERLSSLERADMFAATKTDRSDNEGRSRVKTYLGYLAHEKPVVFAAHAASFLSDITGAAYPAETLAGKKVLLVSGIADPGYFAAMAEALGADVVGRLDHPDHHRYTQGEIDVLPGECRRKNAEIILTTKKDHVKIRELDLSGMEDRFFILNVKMDIVEGKELLVAGLNSVLSGNRA